MMLGGFQSFNSIPVNSLHQHKIWLQDVVTGSGWGVFRDGYIRGSEVSGWILSSLNRHTLELKIFITMSQV